MKDVSDALHRLIGLFDQLGLQYAVMGGIAVRAYGIPRATYDVDFMLAVQRERLDELYNAVDTVGYFVPESYRGGWVDQVAGMPLVKFGLSLEGHSVDIDVFLAESPFQREVLRRRRLIESLEGSIFLVSPEDLVLLKLLAYRPRDVADVLDVLHTQGQLEEAYLELWAVPLGVGSRLQEVLSQDREMF